MTIIAGLKETFVGFEICMASVNRFFSRIKRQKFKIDCVYSDELPVFPREDGTVSCEREAGEDYRLNCSSGFGSASYLTGTVGFFLAAEVVKRIAFAEE